MLTLRRLMVRGALLTGVVILVAVVVALLSQRFAPDPVDTTLVVNDPAALGPARTEGGGEFDLLVPPERIPRGLDEELSAPALTLIPERQTRPIPAVAATQGQLEELTRVVRRFLIGWETFAADDDDATYQSRFAAVIDPSQAGPITARRDNHQDTSVGRCGVACAGSAPVLSAIDPGYYMTVRRIDDRGAYVSTQMVVHHSGGRSLVNGHSYRRSYAMILRRSGGRWVVARVAAETLARH